MKRRDLPPIEIYPFPCVDGFAHYWYKEWAGQSLEFYTLCGDRRDAITEATEGTFCLDCVEIVVQDCYMKGRAALDIRVWGESPDEIPR